MVIYVKAFQCGFCGAKYERDEDAIDCWDEHQEPDVYETTLYKCSICEKVCDDEIEAQLCEKTHEKNNDSLWQEYVEEKRKKDLLVAGESKSQKKLI